MKGVFIMLNENLDIIKNNIEKAKQLCGRNDNVKIIAITKTRSPQEINQLLDYNIDTIGENRIQELIEKYDKINSRFDIQVVGQLQTNKVKYTVGKISCIQSLDRVSLAKEIEKQYNKADGVIDVLVEVNLTGQAERGGVPLQDVMSFCHDIVQYKSIRLKGLMAVAPIGLSETEIRRSFASVRKIYSDVKSIFPTVERLSMGMSNDYELAILEGATEIRLGTALFGRRNLI